MCPFRGLKWQRDYLAMIEVEGQLPTGWLEGEGAQEGSPRSHESRNAVPLLLLRLVSKTQMQP